MNNLVKKSFCSLLAFVFLVAGIVVSAQAASETNLCRDTGVAFAIL
ncbi:hypothetical protein [Vibrio cincinnatiensis]|nr:hypothetical protein [Vibrio cincinnatiensis]